MNDTRQCLLASHLQTKKYNNENEMNDTQRCLLASHLQTNKYIFFGAIPVNYVKMIVHCKTPKKVETDACKLERWEIWQYTAFVLVLIFADQQSTINNQRSTFTNQLLTINNR